MPWWLLIYLLAVAVVAILGARDEIQDGGPIARAAIELIADALLITAALAYWLEPVRILIGSAGPVVYVAGLSGVGLSAVREIKKLKPDPELSRRGNFASVVLGVGLFIALYSPLVYWGFSHAYGGRYHGA
jgi:hypothetical protein